MSARHQQREFSAQTVRPETEKRLATHFISSAIATALKGCIKQSRQRASGITLRFQVSAEPSNPTVRADDNGEYVRTQGAECRRPKDCTVAGDRRRAEGKERKKSASDEKSFRCRKVYIGQML